VIAGIQEVLPGVHHWTRVHPRIRAVVSSCWFDALLFAHGDPLVGGGKQALRELVAARLAG